MSACCRCPEPAPNHLLCMAGKRSIYLGESALNEASCHLRFKANSACARTETTYILFKPRSAFCLFLTRNCQSCWSFRYRRFGVPQAESSPSALRGQTDKELAALGRIVFNFTGLNWCAERLLAGVHAW
jgi:hypothetical protein